MTAVRHADLLLDAGASLGEGPRWDTRRGRLLWLDVDAKLLHATDPATGGDHAHPTGASTPGAAAPRAGGGVALATSTGFVLADDLPELADGRRIPMDTRPDECMNDGACDPAGRFLAGTYAADERPGGGRLYRLDPDGTVSVLLGEVTLSNGLDWSPDGRRLYYVDSATQGVDVFDYDPDGGHLTGRRRLLTVDPDDGIPDGLTVDHDGALWLALWGGAQVRRYTPTGRLDRTVGLPTDHVTACAFGGTGGDTLFITTAAGHLEPPARDRQPHAGGLFALRPGVTGPAARPFAG